MTAASPHWRDDAACRDTPTDWFFPDTDSWDNHGRDAKAICQRCPVREECLYDGLNDPYGIVGGAGEHRRRNLRRALRISPERYATVAAIHFRALDNKRLYDLDRRLLESFGGEATHGRRVTHAKGCRCGACGLAAGFDGAEAKLERKRQRIA